MEKINIFDMVQSSNDTPFYDSIGLPSYEEWIKVQASVARIEIKKLYPDAILPKKAHPTDAAYDLYFYGEDLDLDAGERVVLGTGISMALPENFVAKVCSRSGLAAKNGMFVLNAPGIIDSSYLDEIKVILVNSGDSYINIKKGHRIAQLIIERLPLIDLVEVKEFTNTSDRGGGLGSTGK